MKPTRLDRWIDSANPTGGRWVLTPDHEIRYQSKNKEEQFRFKGAVVAAEPEALVLSVTSEQIDQNEAGRIVKLAGKWKVNAKNQIQFEVEKESGKNDILTFKGAWRVNQNNEIAYAYRKKALKSKKHLVQELVFDGFWDFSEKNRLIYRLSADSKSAFDFRGAFQTKSILAKTGELRYQIGVEIHGKPKTREIVLFGKWKLSRELELSFEVERQDGRPQAIVFGGEFSIGKDRRIAIGLRNRHGKPFGTEVVFTKDFFGKDGQVFVRLVNSLEESRIEGGVRFRW
jgi:hypothetical protein